MSDAGERAIVQLAGCLMASEGNTELVGDDGTTYGWSPAYESVAKLYAERNALKTKLETTQERWRVTADHLVEARAKLEKAEAEAERFRQWHPNFAELVRMAESERDAARSALQVALASMERAVEPIRPDDRRLLLPAAIAVVKKTLGTKAE